MLAGENGIITEAVTSKVVTELSGIKEQIELKQMEEESKNESLRYMTVKEVNEKIKDIPEEYKGRVGLYREEPIFLGKDDEEISNIAKNYGYRIINMTENEFSYYIEMGILEDSIIENRNKNIGRELSTADFPETIKIDGKSYSTGWYLIGNYTEEEKSNNTYGNHFEELGLKDITHAPYIVNYDTGNVFSIDGMIMYQAEISIHTFQDNNFKLTNAITYVDTGSEKNEQNYGNLYSVSSYEGERDNFGAQYNDNNGKLEYDEDGALILDQDNSIPVLDVNDKYKISDSYSVNVTVKPSSLDQKWGSTIVALSDVSNKYICWISLCESYLQIHSYKKNPVYYKGETKREGFASINISEYKDKMMNIQVVAERGKETKVYINGELIETFQSGNEIFTYKYVTLGDLRVGRNLKFTGKIYNFAIYGVALNEEEIQENYEETKK